jgi:hypothetical protein
MKKLLALLALLTLVSSSRALDFTYSTNLFYALPGITNVYLGTNGTDTNRDTYVIAWNKLNHNDYWLSKRLTDYISTNTGGSGLTNIYFTNGNVSGVSVFNNGKVAGFTLTATNTYNVTNTITTVNFSNQVVSSREITVTNVTRNLTGSNYVGRFSGFTRWQLTLPILGGSSLAPGTNPTENVWMSLTGTNNWFQATNNNPIFTNVSVSIVGANVGTNAGNFQLFTSDHPETWNLTNYFYGQHWAGIPTPVANSDLANKGYVDGVFAGAQNLWTSYTDTNSVYHSRLVKNGVTVADFATTLNTIPINAFYLDGTGTNLAMEITQTNLTVGWTIQSVTNLLYLNNWTTFTNYTAATNSGIVTFTIPINFTLDTMFFRALGNPMNSFIVTPTITASAGTYYPSNTWSLYNITNGMGNFGFWQGSSNGQALVTLSLSNGVVRYLQSLR